MDKLDLLYKKYLTEVLSKDGTHQIGKNIFNIYLYFKKEILKIENQSIPDSIYNYHKIKHVLRSMEGFFEWLGSEYSRDKQCKDNPTISNIDLYQNVRKQINGFKLNKDIEKIQCCRKLQISQLERRFKIFNDKSNHVFYKGIADYIKYILENQLLNDLIKKHLINQSTQDKVTWYNCIQHSWFNLELVYLLIYKKQETLKLAAHCKGVRPVLQRMAEELEQSLSNNINSKSLFFKKEVFDADIIRLHQFIIETLERNGNLEKTDSIPNQRNPSQTVVYDYIANGIATGKLCIKNFHPIDFIKLPAIALQFFYLSRNKTEFYSYQDFNKFISDQDRKLTSNEFRLLIDKINNRVRSSTNGSIANLIQKKESNISTSLKNVYKWTDTHFK
jgi:hypothetical protein